MYKTSETLGNLACNYVANKMADAFGCGCLVGIILGAALLGIIWAVF